MKTFKKFLCPECNLEFQRELRQCCKKVTFCSKTCNIKNKTKSHTLNCTYCKKQFVKKNAEFKQSDNHFCSRNCAASFNNTKRRRSRRSKAEIMLYDLLVAAFPKLNIIANDKEMLNGLEIDIAIPSLKLGIEWNGIVHFKPIYGLDKLNKIQSIDSRKQILANQLNINLIVIPDLVSTEKYVKECFITIQTLINELSCKFTI